MTEWTTKGKLPTKADELRSLIKDAQRKGFNWRPANADVLAALDAAYAQGYARAMDEVVAEVQTRTEAAVSSYYADRSSYREGYSDACDTLCELVQHMAQTRCD